MSGTGSGVQNYLLGGQGVIMSDLKHYRRLAELWENNAAFYLKEIERANWLFNELLKKYEDLESKYKALEKELFDAKIQR